MKFRIFHKGLLLVLVPLTFELFVFSTLMHLSQDEERAIKKANKAQQIASEVQGIVMSVAMLGKVSRGLSLRGVPASMSQYHPDASAPADPINPVEAHRNFKKSREEILGHLKNLKELLADNPKQLEVVLSTEKGALELNREMQQTMREILDAGFDNSNQVLSRHRHDLDRELSEMVSPGLLNIAAEANLASDSSEAEHERASIRNLLSIAVCVSVSMAALLLFVFSSNISKRLKRLMENTSHLAARKPLLPVLQGSDEIVELDAAIHTTAAMLEQSEDRLQRTFDNASDFICSLSKNFQIEIANNACLDFVGVPQHDLIGARIINFMPESERQKFLDALDACKLNSSERMQVEINLVAGKQRVQTVLIPKWVDAEQTYFCVFHDISARKKAEQIKNEVFAMVSHDLRAPLNSFSNFVEMFEMGILGSLNEKGTKFLAFATQSVGRMSKLVEDILVLEKIRSGAIKPAKQTIDVPLMLQSIAGAMEIYANINHINIDVVSEAEHVQSDESLIAQILSNFLSNALRVSPPNSSVQLSYRREGKIGIFSVGDRGRGIAEDKLEKIFERFYTVDNVGDDANNIPSSGLGLTLAWELATLLNGNVSVQSKINQGSTFSLTVPVQ